MTRHELIITGDNAEPSDDIVGAEVVKPWITCTVTAEAGLFKQGELYDKGATIALHPDAASRFIEAGEVELSNE
jgi:hypothetical protein